MFAKRSIIYITLLGLGACSAPEPPTTPDPVEEQLARVKAHSNTWNTEPDYSASFSALDPALTLSGRSTTSLFDPADDYWGLPRTEGYDLIDAYCTACHTLQIVMQQSATPERWDYMLDWMVREQGMAPMIDGDRDIVLKYLVETFGNTESK